MKIVFVIGRIVVSGGNYVVFQHALHARKLGHDVTLATLYPFTQQEVNWHPALAKLRLIHIDQIEGLATQPFDLAIATWWRTALELHRFSARQYAYFVQSIESRFFEPHQESERRIVDETYALGLPGITEATWIQSYLKQHYGSDFLLARNGIWKELYLPTGTSHAPRVPGKLRVLVEGPFSLPFKNTARSVRLSRRGSAFETWLLTSSNLNWYPGVARVFSRVPIQEVAAIYRSCDVILKLSFVEGMFGPPLEMFHCGGTAVVYDVSGHDEYIVDGSNALVAKMNDEATVLGHLSRLRDEPDLMQALKDGAAQTAAAWPDWGESSARFVSHLEAICKADPMPRAKLVEANEYFRLQYPSIFESGRSAIPTGNNRGLLSSGIRSTKTKLNAVTTLLGYIAEGYRAPYDHRHALQPSISRTPPHD